MNTIESSQTLVPARVSEESVVARNLLARMRQSLSRGEFHVAYQPFLRVSTGEVVGVEALARWTEPAMGEIPPSQFIPMAESSGFIHELTEWMLAQVLREADMLSLDGREPVVAVHVSPHVLAQPEFSTFLEGLIPESRRGRMILEITERRHLHEGEEDNYHRLVTSLVGRGFRFAIDDFGTGYSDLRRIVRFPAHILKTDVSLLRNPENERRGNIVLSLVADVALQLNMRVLAEGVESQEQWDNVRKFGVEYAKGYHICEPLPAGELKRWLKSVSSGSVPLPGRGATGADRSDAASVPTSRDDRPILVVGDGGGEWLELLRTRTSHPLLRADPEGAGGMFEHFDLHLCVICIQKLTTEHFALLQRRRRFQPDTPILVLADGLDAARLVRLMRGGVTDFVLLPSEPDEIVDRILEHASKREAGFHSLASSEKMVRHLRERMEWESYKESRTLTADNRFGQKTIDHLRVSLTQGAGFGLLLTVIEMMGGHASGEEAAKHLSPEVVRLLIDNGRIAWKHIRGLEAIVNLMGQDFPVKRMGSREFFRLTTEALSGISAFYRQKGLRLNVPDLAGWGAFSVELEPSHFTMALQELAVNAYKYAVPNTDVDLVATLRAGYLCLGLKNIVEQEPYGGVPEDMEERVTEPFYRLHPPVEDAIEFETFGMGLGLTAVKYIMHRHRGMLSVKDVRDHSLAAIRPAVLASLYVPFEAQE